MFGLEKTAPTKESAVVIDVGSGSVGAALVVSDAEEKTVVPLWSMRERVPLGDVIDADVSIKQINAALMNVFLAVGSTAAKKLHEHDSSLKIGFLQVTLSAPWTHTVIKTVNYSDDHPFEVTQELIEEITATAAKQATEAIIKDTALTAKGAVAIDNENIGVVTNGYNVPNAIGSQTRELSIAHLTALTQKEFQAAIDDSHNKLLPQARAYTHSFMFVFHEAMKRSASDTREVCLIDITSEATEIGIVRDGLLMHVTHIPYGTFTLAREIAAICDVPKEEAYGYLKGGGAFLEEKISKTKQNEMTIAFTAYEEKVAKLFKSTGDRLAIPKTLFLHTDTFTEKFFKERIEEAASIATGIKHTVHMVTSEILETKELKDTALQLSISYFQARHIEEHERA